MRTRKFSEIRERLEADPDRAEQLVKAEADVAKEYAAFQQTLSDLRRARTLTQEEVGRVLGVSQAQVSRIENQADLYLSTLSAYINAMGGELRLAAAFGDRVVPLMVGDLAGEVGAADDAAPNERSVSVPAAAN